MARPAKRNDLLQAVRTAVLSGAFALTEHVKQRMRERRLQDDELLAVLLSGYHEKAKDRFHAQYEAWDYAIRGRTVDRRDLRVVITFHEGLVVITVIDLDA